MQKQNIREYELARKELFDIRNCITTYVGFVIGGSGVAFMGITLLSNRIFDPLINIGLPLVMSVLLSMVQTILYYKFTSHNRYAGYCKLLNHERHKISNENSLHKDADIILWEACMDVLRDSDSNVHRLSDLCDRIDISNLCEGTKKDDETTKKTKLKSFIGNLSGRKPVVDNNKNKEGYRYLFAFFGHKNTDSWPFPIYIIFFFFALFVLFAATSVYFLIKNKIDTGQKGGWDHFHYWLGLTIVILLSQGFAWYRFLNKLYALLHGSATVDSYCWKFLPIRAFFLNKEEITPEYLFMRCPSCNAEKQQSTRMGTLKRFFNATFRASCRRKSNMPPE